MVSAIGLVLVGPACQGPGVARGEIPDDPIAFIFHPEDEARRRAEVYEKRAASNSRSRSETPAVVQLNSFRDYLEEVYGNRADVDVTGRLALLYPSIERVTLIESARKGAIPLAWSPDRERLLFAQWDLGRLQLFEIDPDSRVVSRLTGGPDHHPQGCYGPDCRMIAVVAKRAVLPEVPSDLATNPSNRERLVSRIVVLGPGDGVESISTGPADGDPACSPDGTAVAYVRLFSDARSEIWIHSFADEQPAHAIAQGRDPSFSPDGEWIVYSDVVGNAPRLWRIRRDGSGRTRLGRGSGADEYGPVVSPDGSLVVYESVFENRYRLFVRRFDGTGDRVLFADGDGTHAVW